MAVKAILSKEEHAQLPDALKSEYKEVTEGEALKGRFLLDVSPVDGYMLDDTEGLKRALQSERTLVAEAKASLKTFDGLDAIKAREALGKLEEIDKWDPDQKLDEHKKKFELQMQEKYEGEAKSAIGKLDVDLKAAMTRGESMLGTLSGALIDNAAIRALEQNGGAVKLLLPHIKMLARIAEADGKFAVEVLGQDGNVRLSPQSGNTGPMSVAELVAEMKGSDEFAAAFSGSGASGSGAQGASGGQGGGSPAAGAHTITESDARDHHKYVAAKTAAEKAGVPLQMVEG